MIWFLLRYESAESSDFLDNEGADKTKQLNFTNGATEATLSIDIDPDDIAEDNGTISVTLSPDNMASIKYTVAPAPNDSATITIYDDDSPPTISMTAENGEIAENAGPAQFMLSATGLSATTTLLINATPTEVAGDFLTGDISDTARNFSVEFSDPDGDSTYHGEFSVPIHNDFRGETTGDIRLNH